MSTETIHPVVSIHGFMGYGRDHPFDDEDLEDDDNIDNENEGKREQDGSIEFRTIKRGHWYVRNHVFGTSLHEDSCKIKRDIFKLIRNKFEVE